MSCEIELEIGPGAKGGEFTTRVVRAASGGEPAATARLDVDGLLRNRDALEAMVVASGVTGRGLAPAEQELQRVGAELFDALFSGAVLGTYRASLGMALQRAEPLRVVLRLTAPQLAALPWEAMFDLETSTYICRKEPLVRHVAAPYTPEPLEVVPPLRVLGLIASPRGMPVLDVTAEQQHLSDALAGPIADGLIELEWLTQASWDAVQDRLLSSTWHVLHFIGHGDYDVGNDQGLIALVGPDRRANLVEAARLADLLGQAQPNPRLVVLNSCSSGEQGTRDLFSGTAAALVHSGISAVAAMQFTVSDSAAIAFSRGFYTAIAHGHSVDNALGSGRVAILGTPHTLEWVTPVLYVRGDTTQLFKLSSGSPNAVGPRRPPVAKRRPVMSAWRNWPRSGKVLSAAGAVLIAVTAVVVYFVLRNQPAQSYVISVQADRDTYSQPTFPSYLFPDRSVPPPSPPSDTQDKGRFWQWARANGGIDLDETLFRFAVSARTVPIIVQGIRPIVVGTLPPKTGVSVRPPFGTGVKGQRGPIAPDELSVDLDNEIVEGDQAFDVEPGKTELFDVTATANDCNCEWRLQLNLLVDGKPQTRAVDDKGKPFVTLSSKIMTATDYRWSPQTGWQPTGRQR
ncbi:CHAT domain-containing protein [Mycobacterium sp. E3247]|uniref:CHAT domain-containing protein n=1 Tax=Mycobacterium sp. E3247 TaxID=1856864 RepID=UPI000800E804|nr:CHAT domain-containing protein [Mycobacterium sp. E3247]OBH15181.1 hypothetical protein A9X04_13250 [Mycobacterium sp. E3247]